jgi:hypothetical protein
VETRKINISSPPFGKKTISNTSLLLNTNINIGKKNLKEDNIKNMGRQGDCSCLLFMAYSMKIWVLFKLQIEYSLSKIIWTRSVLNLGFFRFFLDIFYM